MKSAGVLIVGHTNVSYSLVDVQRVCITVITGLGISKRERGKNVMNNNGLDLYKKASKINDSPRETEARVLTNGALKLKECMDNWESEERRRLLSEALHFNQKIWTIFQTDLTSKECRLPRDMRLNLLRLSAFVDKQIFTIMTHPSPEKLIPIIDVNLSLAAGLRKKPDIKSMPEVEKKKSDDTAGNRLEITG